MYLHVLLPAGFFSFSTLFILQQQENTHCSLFVTFLPDTLHQIQQELEILQEQQYTCKYLSNAYEE